MRFPKLKLHRNGERVVVGVYISQTKTYLEHPVLSEAFVGYCTKTTIGFNLDVLKKPKWLLRFHIVCLHEFLHWFFPSFEVTKLIEDIHDKSGGLVL